MSASDATIPDLLIANEIIRALGNELARHRERLSTVDSDQLRNRTLESRNTELEGENARLKRELQYALQALQGASRVKEEEPCILLAGNV